ncbi:MAG: ArnT family glycosyltransferase, partial [Nitrospinales bacterium]
MRYSHWWLLGAVGLMTLPFLNKALHIDDPAYIYQARQILLDPVHPFDFQFNWLGVTSDAIHSINHPPLLSYYLALIISLFGESEPVLHASLMIFPLIAVYSISFLTQRFTNQPLPAMLMLMFAPPFFVSASTLMLDVPVLALALAATALFIRGLDIDNMPTLAFSGVVLAAACLIKYSAVLQFPVLGLYAMLQGKTRKALIPLGLAMILVSSWIWFTWVTSGILHPLQAIGLEGDLKTPMLAKWTSLLSFTGVSALVAGFLPFAGARRWAVLLASLALTYFFILPHSALGWVSQGLLAILVFNGTYLFGWVIAGMTDIRNFKDRDTLFLIVWFGITAAFVVQVIAFNAVRHVLIFLVPMVLLLFRMYPAPGGFKFARAQLAALLLLSLAVSFGDHIYANAYRGMADRLLLAVENQGLRDEGIGRQPNNTVWFRTHWGFQYYMENRGAKMLEFSNVDQVKEGDWIVDTVTAHKNFIAKNSWPVLRMEREFDAVSPLPVHLMNSGLGAGWYADIWGPLPFAWGGKSPMETFTLSRVVFSKNDTEGA